jgi:hypothetical protein
VIPVSSQGRKTGKSQARHYKPECAFWAPTDQEGRSVQGQAEREKQRNRPHSPAHATGFSVAGFQGGLEKMLP